MVDTSDISARWKQVEDLMQQRFGKVPDLEAILFLIGVQELGQTGRKFTKEQKQDLMHIAVCTLLSQSGYYKREGVDGDGWPHFTELKPVSGMDLEGQETFLKAHIIHYFDARANLPRFDHADR
jgi:hypothetical protein